MPKKVKAAPTLTGDHITGTIGNDWIEGGSGDDFLTGLAGSDKFILRAGGGHDVVTDFNPAAGDRVLFDEGHAYSDILYLGQLQDGLTFDNGYGTATFHVSAVDYDHNGTTDTMISVNDDSIVLLGWAPEQLYGWSLMGG